MIELRLLRYFIAVAELEHVGRAAARLHISQSPLSRQIRQLEDLLGIALFERERRRIRLSDAGRWLLGPAREMLERADSLARDARELAAGNAGQIAIGFVGAALVSGVLPAALRKLRSERPRVHIALRQMSSREQLAGLRAGTLDLALIHRQPMAAGLEERRLLEQPYVLAVPRTSSLARARVQPAHLDGQPWIIVAAADADHDPWSAAWAAAGFTPNIVVRVVEWSSALALVDAGVGLAFVPQSYARVPPAGVGIRRLPWLRVTSRLTLVRRRTSAALVEDVTRWLVDAAAAVQGPAPSRKARPPRARQRRPSR